MVALEQKNFTQLDINETILLKIAFASDEHSKSTKFQHVQPSTKSKNKPFHALGKAENDDQLVIVKLDSGQNT